MRTLTLKALGVSLGLGIGKIRSWVKLERAWEKADDPPDTTARTVKQLETKGTRAAEQIFAAEARRELWVDCSCCWVVVCKNHWFHRKRNLFNVHRIPLGETDTVSTRPSIKQHFIAQCDECFKEYVYKPSEVLRWEMQPPPSFIPHPLFRDCG
jgi:hypothetical protein